MFFESLTVREYTILHPQQNHEQDYNKQSTNELLAVVYRLPLQQEWKLRYYLGTISQISLASSCPVRDRTQVQRESVCSAVQTASFSYEYVQQTFDL